jgi:hypothetical protein
MLAGHGGAKRDAPFGTEFTSLDHSPCPPLQLLRLASAATPLGWDEHCSQCSDTKAAGKLKTEDFCEDHEFEQVNRCLFPVTFCFLMLLIELQHNASMILPIALLGSKSFGLECLWHDILNVAPNFPGGHSKGVKRATTQTNDRRHPNV